MTTPSARVLLDSISQAGHRVTTMEVVMHRFALAEFNTHRVFSRNSASSRAIPVKKMIERVHSDIAYPVVWPSEKSGMSGGPEIGPHFVANARTRWSYAAEIMIEIAEEMSQIGVHKSVTNRLLEPFLWQTIIVTSTEWDNFFKQRISPGAQPELREAAIMMKIALELSQPQELVEDEWHMPLLQPDELDFYGALGEDMDEQRKWVSAARCARVSYLTHDGRRDIEKDIELYQRLVRDGHWSPLEHVCRPIDTDDVDGYGIGARGNLHGWVQLRHIEEDRKQSAR